MIDLGPQERLQPALLDRLTNEEPFSEEPEPLERRVMDKRRLKEAVRRDLGWLLNATRLEAAGGVKAQHAINPNDFPAPKHDFARWPHVQRSVINYGLAPFAGRPLSSTIDEIQAAIKEAIQRFEPRILVNDNLKITVLTDTDASHHHNVIGVKIEANVWAEPVPMELILRSDFELETGTVTLVDLRPSRSE